MKFLKLIVVTFFITMGCINEEINRNLFKLDNCPLVYSYSSVMLDEEIIFNKDNSYELKINCHLEDAVEKGVWEIKNDTILITEEVTKYTARQVGCYKMILSDSAQYEFPGLPGCRSIEYNSKKRMFLVDDYNFHQIEFENPKTGTNRKLFRKEQMN